MAKSVTPDAISTLLANPSPDSSSEVPEIVVQVLDLKPTGSKYITKQGACLNSDGIRICTARLESINKHYLDYLLFTASDGKMKLKALLQSSLSSKVMSGNIQNLGLIRIVDYTVNDIPTKNEKFRIVIKCDVVSPAIEEDIKIKVKIDESGVILKPKQEI